MRIHGSRELQLTINVPELRRVMGLSNNDFLASGIFESFVPPPEPGETRMASITRPINA
ncbi:hypothetical protein JG688_00016718 [Phytophthora aleatoria]|uniref:Uncharacterized protein n=1 Tax=Phytophthora aleatoria TaxID=2496075 RepID=A0A8J5I7W1_9STRA|nr:hypothetical protein JG688_00016718 [Phytophthora aleatoria]